MNQYNYLQEFMRVPAALTYMSVYFQVFALLVEDKNPINADKCRTIHPYQALVNILSYTHKCWPVQYALRAYANRLYYRFHAQNNYVFIEQDLSNIIVTLDAIIHYKMQYYKKQTQITNPVRYQYLFTYVYTTLQEIIFSLNLILVDDDFLVQLEEYLNAKIADANYETHCDLFHLTAQLIEISNLWFKSNYITSFLNDLTNLLKCIFNTFPLPVLHNLGNIISQTTFLSQDSNEVISQILQSMSIKTLNRSEDDVYAQNKG